LDIVKIVGIGLLAAALGLVVREQKPVFAFLLAVAAGWFVFFLVVEKISSVFDALERMAREARVDPAYLKIVLKVIGIAYIAEFGAQAIRDAGHEAVAAKVELAGKVLILAMAVPIVTAMVETVVRMLPGA